MFSIYTSAFNLKSSGLEWKDALENFSSFVCPDGEVVLAVNKDKDNSIETIKQYFNGYIPIQYTNIKIIETNFSFEDPLMDGKIKNAALQNCINDYCISLDLDERINLKNKPKWELAADLLGRGKNLAGLLISSVNLCGSQKTYKDIGQKWYLHKRIFNGKKLERGVVNFAKNIDGTIDINKSDSCELIDQNGNLIPTMSLITSINGLRSGNYPFIFHQWAVDYSQRITQNKIWKPVWEARANKPVNNIILDRADLEKIPVFEHNLELW